MGWGQVAVPLRTYTSLPDHPEGTRNSQIPYPKVSKSNFRACMTSFSECTTAVLTLGQDEVKGNCLRVYVVCMESWGVEVHSSKALHGVRQSWELQEKRARDEHVGVGDSLLVPYLDLEL